MADNRLQITAELIDKVSPSAKKMQKALEDLQKASGKQLPEAFKKYQNAINANEKALQNYGKRSESTRRELRAFQEAIMRVSPSVGRLTESLGAFATGSGVAVTAITAVGAGIIVAAKQASDFATQMKQLRFGSEASGLGQLQLTQSQQALRELGLTLQESTGTLVHLKEVTDDAAKNAGDFMNSMQSESFRPFAAQLIDMGTKGEKADEVLLKLLDQLDELKEKAGGGAQGMDAARRYLSNLGLDPRLALTTGKQFRERLEYNAKHGSTGPEMKEAAEQAEIWRDKMFKGHVWLDRIGVVFKTDVTKTFLEIYDILNRIAAKYVAWDPTQQSGPLAGQGYGGGSTVGGSGGGGSAGSALRNLGTGYVPPGGPTPGGSSTQPGAGGGGETPFSGRFGAWSPAALQGHSGHIPAGATGPLGSTRTGAPNIGGPLPRPRPSGAGGTPEGGASSLEGIEGDVDRSRFSGALDNDAFVARMASMVKGEVRLNSNPRIQQAITEQAFNRWDTRDQQAGADLYHGRGGYYAAGTFQPVSAAEIARYKENILKPVLEGGSDVIKGMTGNASNEPGNMVAMHQFGRGTPGFWMSLRTGEEATDAQGNKLPTSYMGGQAEAMFMEKGSAYRHPVTRMPQQNRVSMNAALSGTQATTVTGNGKVDVTVAAQSGKSGGSELFKRVQLRRDVQMQRSAGGPEQQFSGSPL